MTQNRLPDFSYSYKLDCNSNFNNQLMAGHNVGLALYDYDSKLYRPTDTSKISTRVMNFDKINAELYEKGKAYNQGKQLINGAIHAVNKAVGDTEKNIKDTIDAIINYFSKMSDNIKLILGASILFIILQKK